MYYVLYRSWGLPSEITIGPTSGTARYLSKYEAMYEAIVWGNVGSDFIISWMETRKRNRFFLLDTGGREGRKEGQEMGKRVC